jgi:hypothetical protein
MRNITFILLLVGLLVSCGVKQTQSYLNSGNYDNAISNAISSLRNNKNAKGKQDYVYLLEEAFAKAKERDLRSIASLSKDANPANLEKIFNTYRQLHQRQEQVRPLLPLQLIKEGRQAIFPMEDYTDQIIDSKNALSKYLYTTVSTTLSKSNNKMEFRKAYDDLQYLENINPGYKDVKRLMDDAWNKGTDYVNVYTKNETNMVIPVALQNDLLDFSTYGLNDKWTVYHSAKQKGIVYDYAIAVNFRQIAISPEQIKEKEFVKEKQIKDGTKNLYDNNGRLVKDSLGNAIKVDNFKTIKASIYEFTQFKSAQVTAKVDYINLNTNQLIDTFPLTSEYVFEYIYATYNGDKRACEESYYPYFTRKAVVFPSNEQMVYDTGEDVKAKLKAIITRNKLRR